MQRNTSNEVWGKHQVTWVGIQPQFQSWIKFEHESGQDYQLSDGHYQVHNIKSRWCSICPLPKIGLGELFCGCKYRQNRDNRSSSSIKCTDYWTGDISQFQIRSNQCWPTWRLTGEKNIFHMYAIKKSEVEIQNDFQSLYWCSLWWHPEKKTVKQAVK